MVYQVRSSDHIIVKGLVYTMISEVVRLEIFICNNYPLQHSNYGSKTATVPIKSLMNNPEDYIYLVDSWGKEN